MTIAFNLVRDIDALLPQTQCGLCGHRDGCLPYAYAIAEGEAANKCVPGGQPVADALAKRLDRVPLKAEQSVWPIQDDGRPQRMKAVIREEECIGCTKCISACPVDAIIGSAKKMHDVLTDWCTGCELCIAPCPVDCIDLVVDPKPLPSPIELQQEQDDLRQRYYAHIAREEKQNQKRKGPVVRERIDTALFARFSQQHEHLPEVAIVSSSHEVKIPIQNAVGSIEQARLRTQIKKLQKQLSVRFDPEKAEQLDQLLKNLTTV